MGEPGVPPRSDAGGLDHELGREPEQQAEEDEPGDEVLRGHPPVDAASSSTTKRIEPAASARNRIDSDSLTHACPISVPTNVGPPPIRPRRSRKRQLGRTGSPESGATIPKPSVALCRPKPMIRTIARLISPGRAGLADREALGEVVQPDPGRDQEREPRRRRQGRDPGLLELRCRRRARAEHRLAALPTSSSRRSRRGSSARRRCPPRRAPRTRRSEPSCRRRPRPRAPHRPARSIRG